MVKYLTVHHDGRIRFTFLDWSLDNLSDGYIIQVDHSDIKKMTAELQKIGININQIAKRANATGNVYQEDIEEIKYNSNKRNYIFGLWKIKKESKGISKNQTECGYDSTKRKYRQGAYKDP